MASSLVAPSLIRRTTPRHSLLYLFNIIISPYSPQIRSRSSMNATAAAAGEEVKSADQIGVFKDAKMHADVDFKHHPTRDADHNSHIFSHPNPQSRIMSSPSSSPQIPTTTTMLFRKQTKTAAPFLKIQRCNACSTVSAEKADLNLVQAIYSEIANFVESENKKAEEMLSPEDREFPYEIIYNPKDTTVTLKRTLPSGENIQIVTRDWENWVKKYCPDNRHRPDHIALYVTIDKGEGHAMSFRCSLRSSGDVCLRPLSVDYGTYEEIMYGPFVKEALQQSLGVRGINSYLFAFYREYMMEKDKGVHAVGKFMVKKNKILCAASKDMISAADDNLKRHIKLNVQVLEQIERPNEVHESHELPEDFPFQITEKRKWEDLGWANITLKRELPCENIEVAVIHGSINFKITTFRIVVIVNKENGPSLRIRCKLDRNGLDIESVEKSDEAKGNARQWVKFSKFSSYGLDMLDYLELKGIKPSLFNFFDEYTEKESMRCWWLSAKNNFDYDIPSEENPVISTVPLEGELMWLKSMRKFLEK